MITNPRRRTSGMRPTAKKKHGRRSPKRTCWISNWRSRASAMTSRSYSVKCGRLRKPSAIGAADLGLKFTCPASEIPALMDSLGHVLDGEMAGMTIAIKKTEAPLRPATGGNHEVPQVPNQGCQNG